MRGKPKPRWVQPFLAGLSRTRNARLAAVEAGIDPTTAYQRRLKHPGFADAWARVVAEGEPPTIAPGLAPGRLATGTDLVERISARHGPQIVRAGPGRWSKRGEDAFLTALAATANVQRACAAAGFSTQALYQRRLKDQHFADSWDAAVAIGRARIEAPALLLDRHGVAKVDRVEHGAGFVVDVDAVMQHRSAFFPRGLGESRPRLAKVGKVHPFFFRHIDAVEQVEVTSGFWARPSDFVTVPCFARFFAFPD